MSGQYSALRLVLEQIQLLELMINNSEGLTPEEKDFLKTKLENLTRNL